jgi:hypothetical protein
MDRDISEIRMLVATLERAMKTMYDLLMSDHERINVLTTRVQELENEEDYTRQPERDSQKY